jgi:hypothetical protein
MVTCQPAIIPDVVLYYENRYFFLDIIGRDETFSEHGFQVSGWLSLLPY